MRAIFYFTNISTPKMCFVHSEITFTEMKNNLALILTYIWNTEEISNVKLTL